MEDNIRYGYCRCSTNEINQDITRQINMLKTHMDFQYSFHIKRFQNITRCLQFIKTLEWVLTIQMC